MGRKKLVSPGAAAQPVKTETDLGDRLAIFEFQLLRHWRKIAVACAVIVAACIVWGVVNTVRSARENSAEEAISAAAAQGEAAIEAAIAGHKDAQAVNVARMELAAAADGRGEYDRALKFADEIIASTGDAEFKCTVELFAAVNREKAGDLQEAFRRFAAAADNDANTASRRTEAACQAGRIAMALDDRSGAAGYLGRAASGDGVYADMARALLRSLEASDRQ